MSRPWSTFEKLSTLYWKEHLHSDSPVKGLDVGDALWQQAKRMHPDWPSETERREDLEAHVKLTETLPKDQRNLE